MLKLQKLVSTPYTPTHDTRPPPHLRNHSLSFLIPTRMRHVRSFHHVVEVVDWHFRADDVSSKGRLSLPVFPADNEGKPGRQVCMMPGLSGESRGRRVFGRGVADATLVDGRMFSPFFRSHRQERLAESKFGELLRRRLWEWQHCEWAVCHTIQCFLSGENNDQQGTSLLWPGTQEASTSSATKRRSTRIGTPSIRLVTMFHPRRSDKSAGSDRSGWTNFVNLKKSCF